MEIDRETADAASRTRGTIGFVGATFFVAVTLSGCTRGEAIESDTVLQSATAELQTIVSSVEATGTVEPIRVIEVKSQAGGEILELPVELGDQVPQGTLLVQIDPRDVRNAFDQAQADLDVGTARFDVAQRQLNRMEQLHDSDIVTEEELEAAILENANSRAALVRATVNLELAENRLQDVTLRAPITGVIVERAIEVGQVITGTRDLTGGTALMKMADLREVQVRMLVDETDIGRLNPGMPAEITVEAYRDRTFRGEVLKIEPQAVVEQNVTMFAVLTRISNEDDLLLPGMNADVEVVIGRQDNVLALPNSAIKDQQSAARILDAFGLEADLGALAQQARQGGGANAAAEGEPEPEEDEEIINGVPLSRVATMSQGERMEWFQGLSGAERGRVMQLFQQEREGGDGGDVTSGDPRPAFVFQQDAEGIITVKAVMIGLSDFDYTQVISGVDEGEEVVSIPMSLIQQQAFINRIRDRMSLPGMGGGR